MRVDGLNMGQAELFYTLFYIMLSVCLLHPPTEFVSAGLTVQNLFSNFLGSEQLHFVYYHMKRASATVMFHSVLPIGDCAIFFSYLLQSLLGYLLLFKLSFDWLVITVKLYLIEQAKECIRGYFLGYALLLGNAWMLNPMNVWRWSLFWQYYVMMSIILPMCAAILVYTWSRKKWDHHPIAKQLQKFAAGSNTWRSVASSINVEFRRIDKFTTGLPGRRLIVTDSWIMKTTTYFVYVAHQTDIHLTVEGTDEHEISYESNMGAQFLNISVNNIHEDIKPFIIRLNAAEYQDLKDKLTAPVRNAQSVIIRMSLSDRFIAAFKHQVQQNPKYKKPDDVEIEHCIGCMMKPSDCKLQKLCDVGDQGDCRNCYCRPMWCVECMARWFANRQDQSKPEEWMSCRSPCPTCRSTFCMADVCFIDDRN